MSFWPAVAAGAIESSPDVAASLMGQGPCTPALGTSQVRVHKELTDERASSWLSFEWTQTADEVLPLCERAPRGLHASVGVQPLRHDARPRLVRSSQAGLGCQLSSPDTQLSAWSRKTDKHTYGLPTQEPGNIDSCVLFSVWRRASHSSSRVGGMSGHTLCSPVVLGLACWWLSLVCALVHLAVALLAVVPFAGLWILGFFFVSFCEGADPRTGFSSAGILIDVLGLWFPASEASRVGGPLVVRIVPGQMVRDRRSPWATILGGEFVYLLRQPSHQGPADRFRTSCGSYCGQCTRWLVQKFLTGATLRRQFYALSRQPSLFAACRCGDFGFVSRHKPAGRHTPDVSAAPDVEASCITS